MDKKMTYEKAVKELEEIVAKLEDGKSGLDDAVSLFERGAELSAFCSECLKNAEMKITQLSAQGDAHDE